LLNQISLNYDSGTATLQKGIDSMYDLPIEKLEKALEKAGFKCEYSQLTNPWESNEEIAMDNFEDYLDELIDNM